jgi:acyl-CoA thioester hydrolase
MLEAATAHAEAQGWPTQRHLDLGMGWVVRTHRIDYLQPAYADEELVVRTWISDFTKVTCRRRYQVVRHRDGLVLLNAETHWAFVEYRSHIPRRIPREVLDAFTAVPDDFTISDGERGA